jgi:hypothetical protein
MDSVSSPIEGRVAKTLLKVIAVDRIIHVNIAVMILVTQFAVRALMDLTWTQMEEGVQM